MSNEHNSIDTSENDQADAVPFANPSQFFTQSNTDPPATVASHSTDFNVKPVPPLRKKNTNKKGNTVQERAPRPFPPLPKQKATNIFNISQANGVQIGNNFTYVINNKKSQTPNGSENISKIKPKKTQQHIKIMQSKEEILPSYVNKISEGLEDWRGLFHNLEYKPSMIDNIYETHVSKGIKEVIYQLLLDWIQHKDMKLGDLCQMLWDQQRYTSVDDIIEIRNQDNLDNVPE